MSFYIIKGDILEQNVDAIVIPCAPHLKLDEGYLQKRVHDVCGRKLVYEMHVALSLLGCGGLDLLGGELDRNCNGHTGEDEEDDSDEDGDHSSEECDEIEKVEDDGEGDCDDGECVPPLLEAHDEDCEGEEEECSEVVVLDAPLGDSGDVLEDGDQNDECEDSEGDSGDGDGSFLGGYACCDGRNSGRQEDQTGEDGDLIELVVC